MQRNASRRFRTALFVCLAFAGGANASETVTVVEYYNRDLDAYFITGRANEQQALDAVPAFSRTGAVFVAHPASAPAQGQTRICRFYISTSSPFASSHFYGRETTDCVVIANASPPGFTNEGFDFAIAVPTGAAQCATNARFPVYRAFRPAANGKTPNHRYLVSLGQYDAMIASGWTGEGVAFCATSVVDIATNELRAARVRNAAETDQFCRTIVPFHYQIGDAQGALTSGDIGNAYTGDTFAPIASATKWLYGAYVTETRRGALTGDDIRYLTFSSGYVAFDGCDRGETVAACASNPQNNQFSNLAVDKFFYGGGHMQQHALQFAGLGSLTPEPLGRELDRVLKLNTTTSQFTMQQPQLAGGVYTTANVYASFLRKLLRGDLFAASQYEAHAVCTNPATCSDAIATPFPSNESPRYGIGHWIEDTTVSDGAYSSAGAFGFYPWIDASKQYYGVIARFDADGRAGMASVACGRVLRNAWNTIN
jgi:Repeat of unknown function (DUF5648)